MKPQTPRLHAGDPGYNPADAASNFQPPPGFNSWREWNLAKQAEHDRDAKAKYDEWINQGNTLPPGAIPIGDPRLKAGGGPKGESNYYYHPGDAPYWLPKYSPEADANSQRIADEEAALGRQGMMERAHAQGDWGGNARYDVDLWQQYIQTHPNATGFLGIGGLPEAVRQKWLQAKASKMYRDATMKQYNQPNHGGGNAPPAAPGHLGQFFPVGLKPPEDPYWLQQAKDWYAKQEGQYLPKAPAPPPGRPTTPMKSTLSAEQQGGLKTDLAGKKGAKAGDKFTKDGHTYQMNPGGAWVDITDPNARVRVTNKQGGFLTDEQRAKNVAAGNKKVEENKTKQAFVQGIKGKDPKKVQAYLEGVAKKKAKK